MGGGEKAFLKKGPLPAPLSPKTFLRKARPAQNRPAFPHRFVATKRRAPQAVKAASCRRTPKQVGGNATEGATVKVDAKKGEFVFG